MTVVVVTPPAVLVDLATAKAHLRVENSENDTLIEAYIAAACGHIDGPGGWLGRAIGPQTLELRTAWCDLGWRDRIVLPYPPITAVSSVKYDDTDSAEQTLASVSYRMTALGEVELISGYSWPSTRVGSDAARVQYTAGYAAIPGPITAAVLLMVGDLYANRETSAAGVVSAIPMSPTVENLLSPYKVWSL